MECLQFYPSCFGHFHKFIFEISYENFRGEEKRKPFRFYICCTTLNEIAVKVYELRLSCLKQISHYIAHLDLGVGEFPEVQTYF